MKTTAFNSTGPYSAHKSLRTINFFCEAPNAGLVTISGDFNGWKPAPMERRVDGWWHYRTSLCHGHHQYRFLIDGIATLDPAATGVGRDQDGEPVSLIAVS